jgi:drug/metabolite transporter (DMT)-like permease
LIPDEKITRIKLIGVLLGFCGVVVLFLPNLVDGVQWSLAGALAIVAATVSYAFAMVTARRHLKQASPFTVAFGQVFTAALISIPISLILDRPWTLSPTPLAVGAVLALALVCTAFAYLLYYWLISHVGATRTSLVTFISPVIAVILGALLLSEPIYWTTLLGLALITIGVALVSGLALGLLQSRPVTAPRVSGE